MKYKSIVKWLIITMVGGAIVSVACFVEADIQINGISINQYIETNR